MLTVLWILDAIAAPACKLPAPTPRATPNPSPAPCGARTAAHDPVASQVQERFARSQPDSGIEVGFGCDALQGPIQQIESGSGHGFDLALYALLRRGDHFDVTGVRLLPSYDPFDLYTYAHAEKRRVASVQGTLAVASVDAVLPTARAAVLATPKEVLPPTTGLGSSGMSSSADFYVRVQLFDGAGRSIEGRYVGYRGSSGQATYLGPVLALEQFLPLLDGIPASEGPVSEADRKAFAQHFVDHSPHMDEDFGWWVTERYLSLAATVGSPGVGHALLQRLRDLQPDPGDTEPRDAMGMRDGSEDRQRVLAINALAHITGLEHRYDSAHALVKVDAAARAYLEACQIGP